MATLQIPTAEVFEPLLYPARYRAAHGGRGSAKSHFFAGLLVEETASRKTDAICLREIQKSIRFSVKKTVEEKIASMNAGYYFDVQDEIIKTIHGGVILFQGMQNHTADSIKSLEGFRIAYLEEAQAFSQVSLDLLRPTFRNEDSEIWAAWNPRLPTDPIDQLLRPPEGVPLPPRATVIRVNYTDNPWFPSVLREEMEYDKRRDPDKYAHIWLGEYQRNSEARVFKNWRIAEFETPSDAIMRRGADWGFAVDPTVLVSCFLGRFNPDGQVVSDQNGRVLFVDEEAYQVGCDTIDIPQLFETVTDARRWLIVADSARPETISHMRNKASPPWSKIVNAVKGPGSLEDGVEFLKSYDIVVHPRCTHVIDEMTLYSYEVDKLTGAVLPKLADKKNHTIDALRYACEGVRKFKESAPQSYSIPSVVTAYNRR